MNTYHRPIETPLRTLRPARETCEDCHWPSKHYGDKLRVFARYATDEANTASYFAMLLKTGGGSLDLGTHGGIHWWHIYSDNRIRYVSEGDNRQNILWVELEAPDGEIRQYTRDGDDLPPLQELEANSRIMDCIDCHNRPTHLFQVPEKAMDSVLQRYQDLQDLPYYKRQALQAVKAEYPSHEEGVQGVAAAITSYYQQEHPEISRQRPDLVARGADEAAHVYGRSVFPGMKTNWGTHANNIGHDDFPGCWRCHDGEMVSSDGEHVIPVDCETCHVFIVEDSPTPPDLVTGLGG
jgi:hypothetical protein